MTRVQLVDDEPHFLRALTVNLNARGYDVDVASSGEEALRRAANSDPDAVLLDLGLPGMDGLAVVQGLRGWSDVPIVILSARDAESAQVAALDAGADDYVTKPFSHGELLARIRVQIRRRGLGVTPPEVGHGVYTLGGLRIDTGTRRLTRDERVIELSAREFDILRLLAEAAGRVVERQQLFASVWGPSFFGDERALDVYIRMIRKKIEPDPSRPMYLHTVRGVGYRLAEERTPDAC